MTPKKVRILFLLYTKTFYPDTLVGLSKQVEGSQRGSDLYKFLQEMVRFDVVTLFHGTEKWVNVYNGEKEINGKKYPVYVIDRDELISFWEKTFEFRLSKRILEDEAIVIE